MHIYIQVFFAGSHFGVTKLYSHVTVYVAVASNTVTCGNSAATQWRRVVCKQKSVPTSDGYSRRDPTSPASTVLFFYVHDLRCQNRMLCRGAFKQSRL